MTSITEKNEKIPAKFFSSSLVCSACDQNKNYLNQNRGTHFALHSYVGTK